MGAGYLAARADAPHGRLQLRVPHLTCGPHETSSIGAVVENVRQLRAGDGWLASVAFRCTDGVASYHSFLSCGGGGDAGPRPRPGNRVVLSYSRNSASIEIDRSDTGVGFGRAQVADRARHGRRPTALGSSSDPAERAAVGYLSLRAGPIGTDGKTFTVRVQHR